jgi:DNA primase
MAIPDEDVAAVRAATDIVALIGEYTPLKRSGRRFVGLCPFHSEKSASFSVNAEEGLYYCFGCQASGDPITFLRAIEGCSFVEAVETLAARAGVAIRTDALGGNREERDKRQGLYDAMEKAVSFYHDRLLSHPDAARARQYLRSRGLEADTVKRFKLGWAPEGGNQLVRALKVPAAALAGAGLVVQGNYGPRDAFRGRLIFPIFQPDGKPVALGGRLVPGIGDGQGPKYRNSPETPIYQKRSTLYGLNLSRQQVVQTGEVIVCEGYTDVIGFFRVGLGRAVATCGTALTEDHFKLLSRFARRVVLAFDADGAGQSAAARFYEWEKRHELEVAVADLPAGEDPGELASKDPDRLRKAVEEARTYLDFRLRRVLSGGDLKSPEGRARLAEAALAVVAEHPNELVRDQYLNEVADTTRIGVEQLRPRLVSAVASQQAGVGRTTRKGAGVPAQEPRHEDDWRGGPPPSPAGPRRKPAPTPGQRAGRDALSLAIHEPAAMAGRLDASLFADPVQKEAFAALASAENLHEAIESAGDTAGELLVELANVDPSISPDQAVVALVRTAAVEMLIELEAEVRAAQQAEDAERILTTAPEIAWIKSELELFSDVGAGELAPIAVTEAAARLVAWLTQRRAGADGSEHEQSGVARTSS